MSSKVPKNLVWKIENFSKSPDKGRVSPTFTPVEGLELNLELIFEVDSKDESSVMKVGISCCEKPESVKKINGIITCTGSDSKPNHLHIKVFELPQKRKKCSAEVFRSRNHKLPDEIGKVLKVSGDVVTLEVLMFIRGRGLVVVGEKAALDTCTELTADFRDIYRSMCNADIKFTFIDGRDLPAHRFILSARSPVFRRMFESDMMEKNSDVFPIADFGADVFDLFLAFLYSCELPDDVGFESLCSLYSAADKYDVASLRNLCSRRLCSSMTVDNAATVLHLATLHSDPEAIQAAKNFIHMNL